MAASFLIGSVVVFLCCKMLLQCTLTLSRFRKTVPHVIVFDICVFLWMMEVNVKKIIKSFLERNELLTFCNFLFLGATFQDDLSLAKPGEKEVSSALHLSLIHI